MILSHKQALSSPLSGALLNTALLFNKLQFWIQLIIWWTDTRLYSDDRVITEEAIKAENMIHVDEEEPSDGEFYTNI